MFILGGGPYGTIDVGNRKEIAFEEQAERLP
jgi:hypothetical protein